MLCYIENTFSFILNLVRWNENWNEWTNLSFALHQWLPYWLRGQVSGIQVNWWYLPPWPVGGRHEYYPPPAELRSHINTYKHWEVCYIKQWKLSLYLERWLFWQGFQKYFLCFVNYCREMMVRNSCNDRGRVEGGGVIGIRCGKQTFDWEGRADVATQTRPYTHWHSWEQIHNIIENPSSISDRQTPLHSPWKVTKFR